MRQVLLFPAPASAMRALLLGLASNLPHLLPGRLFGKAIDLIPAEEEGDAVLSRVRFPAEELPGSDQIGDGSGGTPEDGGGLLPRDQLIAGRGFDSGADDGTE